MTAHEPSKNGNTLDAATKSEHVHQVFENISTDYDKMNDIISLGRHQKWKGYLLDQVLDDKPATVLDLCCGTGDMALRYAQLDPRATITGLDFSANMLTVAEKRRVEAHADNVSFTEGDAMNLPFPDASFDTALISFGLRNVGDYARVISEMRRVVRPGGTVYCIDSYRPENAFIYFFYTLYFGHIMPFIGRVVAESQDEYAWLNRSTELFLTKAEVASLFESCGLSEVSYRAFMCGATAVHRGGVLR
jgi:demethylmenaquinone methyltransferase / 2-methoxy-6-polyprenyl-1,4-benzoquinol methylase